MKEQCAAAFGLLLRRTCDGDYGDFAATKWLKGGNSVPLRSVTFFVEPATVAAMETSQQQNGLKGCNSVPLHSVSFSVEPAGSGCGDSRESRSLDGLNAHERGGEKSLNLLS
ncbi:ATP-dependent zinc metalloprotease FTSH 5, mitochondrial-like [Sesbania bispinosa]|nr:ATP-dependent zinc metalloprotease FTSH 5, mitochondrial-like [Sesbania bispinosa]